MRVFVTGATGYIGSAVVRELLNAGHTVVGLTRSGGGADMLKEAGAEAHYGALDDLGSLQSGAAAADGVIHLAFKHDFSDFSGALTTDLRAVEAMGAALEGSDKPFVITAHANGTASENEVIELAQRGVRTSIVSLTPSCTASGIKASWRDSSTLPATRESLPVVSIPREEADAHFGFLGTMAALDLPRSSGQTQELLGWHPVRLGLMADLEQGHYFNSR